jgi:osmoprotectant transport system substrate-binding protein/osmoprotectant transport system permease protein
MSAFFSDPRFVAALARLPDYLSQHILVSATALALGLMISLPVALLATRRPALRWALLTAASIVQTIPGLALLALFYPFLLGLSGLTARLFGVEFSALGFLPSVLALALYSVLPILRNTVTGILGIDPALQQAARGVGMTAWQSLFMAELPLAMPVIMAGIRTSAVWVIGTATLSTPVGQTSLGNYIFTGLQTQNWVFVLFGCVAAAVLALVVDQLLALMERGVVARKRASVVVPGLALVFVMLAAFLPGYGHSRASYVIGAKPFGEQYILGALIEQRLAAAGLSATARDGLGSSIIFNALAAGDIDAYVDYSGTIFANFMRRSDIQPRAQTLSEVKDWLLREHKIAMLGGLGFENAYALAMARKRAEALGIVSIADLARHAPNLSIAGDYEFFGRPEWTVIRDAYGLRFRQERQMQAEFMYPAAGNEVDVIAAYTSDGRITRYNLVVLDDPKHVIPPYDAILLVSPKRAGNDVFTSALRPLIGAIDVETMRAASLRAEADGSPQAAAAWMWTEIQRRQVAR